MDQTNTTLNQEEILQLLSRNHDEAFLTIFQNGLNNSILNAESLNISFRQLPIKVLKIARKVINVIETLCGTSISKSSVSAVCKDLDQEVKGFRNRPIEESYSFLIMHINILQAALRTVVIFQAFMITFGSNKQEKCKIPYFSAYLQYLERQWLSGVLKITSDTYYHPCDNQVSHM